MIPSRATKHSRSATNARLGLSLVGLTARMALSVAVLATLGVSLFIYRDGTHHFAYLADNLARGLFSVNNIPDYFPDRVSHNGNIYLPFAPMPGVLLAPVVSAFGLGFDELWLAHFFNVVNVLVMLAIFKRLKIPVPMHRFLLALFFSGTIYLSALSVGRSWFLSHIIATTFLLLAIYEVLSRRRVVLIGFWLGLGFLTRSPTVFSFPFFVWMLKPPDAVWLKPGWLISLVVKMALGLAVPLLFYLYYNYARFGNPFETGYALAVIVHPTIASALKQGLFNPIHIPKNLYALLLAVPQAYPSITAPVLDFPYIYPSPWGMGIFFTTPAFIYIFAVNWRERIVRAAGLAVACVALPLILYYGVGWVQFGFRYALDFYPFLFVLTALGMARNFNWVARGVIVLCILINVWGAWWQMAGFNYLPSDLIR